MLIANPMKSRTNSKREQKKVYYLILLMDNRKIKEIKRNIQLI